MTRSPPKFRGPATWALAREAYLTGETATSISARLDIGYHALRRRMKVEGWTRRAVAEVLDPHKPTEGAPSYGPPGRPPGIAGNAPPPAAQVAPAGPPRGMAAAEVARWAVREAGQALAEGRPDAAHRAVRTAEQLTRLLRENPELDPERTLPKSELRTFYRADRSVIEELAEEYGLTPDQAATVDWESFIRTDGSMGARPRLASWLPGAKGEGEG